LDRPIHEPVQVRRHVAEQVLVQVMLTGGRVGAMLRDAAAGTTDALWDAVGRLLARFPPAECARYFVNWGYGQSG